MTNRFPSPLKFILGLIFCLLMPVSAAGQEAVTFSADSVSSDSTTGLLVARGNVILQQAGARLTADRVEYNRTTGSGLAQGTVIFTDPEGGIHYAEQVEMEADFARAFAEQVISNLADNSWVSANRIDYDNATGSNFSGARFTPCNCAFREGETPIWELQSGETTHDAENQTIYHKNVVMYVLEVPVLAFPYLWHPDWTVDRQSGFLLPEVAFSSDFGTTYAQPYYWVTGKTHDLEITPKYYSDAGESVEANYRQLWDNSNLTIRHIYGNLDTFERNRDEVFAIDAEFSTVLADNWRTAARLYHTNQDTFLERYGFDSADSLKSHIYSEQIIGNRYSLIEAYAIQDLREGRGAQQEPLVLPHLFHERYLPTPREDLALRLRLSATNLNNDDFTDVRRFTAEFYGLEEFPTTLGIISAEGRLSSQYRDIQTATNNQGFTGDTGQFSAALGLGWTMPLATTIMARPAVIEPQAKLITVAANDKTDIIPNRDSADFRLDEANLFLLHREQGEDFVEPHTRLDAGVNGSFYDDFFGDISGFIGASWRLSDSNSVGQNQASDTDRLSDILASVTVEPRDWFSASIAARFDADSMHLNESRTTAVITTDKTQIALSYAHINESFFTTADEDVERFTINATQYLSADWSVSIDQVLENNNNQREERDTTISLNYHGGLQDCLTVRVGYKRDGTRDRDIRPRESVFVLLNFKYLGSVAPSF